MYFLLAVIISAVYAQEIPLNANIDRVLTIKLYHAFGTTEKYSSRATIILSTFKGKDINLRQDYSLSEEEISLLKQAAADNGFYHLKAVAYKTNENDTKVAKTFIKACSLLLSNLSDILTISTDYYSNMIGISGTTSNPYCDKMDHNLKVSKFNTTVKVIETLLGPVPDTQTYIERLEMEKAEKLKGDKADNRSFLAKYWMYIVPVLILLIISGASNPELQAEMNR